MVKRQRAIIAVPSLNEKHTILPILESILSDSRADAVWILDGGSTDGTRELVTSYLATSPRLRLIDNPRRTQAHAINLAAKLAERLGFDTLIRIDAHAIYPKNYVSSLLAILEQSEAASVVVPLIANATVSEGAWRKACADLQSSWLGHGGAEHRSVGKSGWVTHGHHAAFDLQTFLHLDGYDTDFLACEDVEFDIRLIAAGYRIWYAAGLPVQYLPRSTPRAYLHQMIRNGQGRANCARKHQLTLAPRQIVPLAATLTSLASIVAGFAISPAFGLWATAYLVSVLTLALLASKHTSLLHSLRICWLALMAQLGFSFGLISSLWQRAPSLTSHVK